MYIYKNNNFYIVNTPTYIDAPTSSAVILIFLLC